MEEDEEEAVALQRGQGSARGSRGGRSGRLAPTAQAEADVSTTTKRGSGPDRCSFTALIDGDWRWQQQRDF